MTHDESLMELDNSDYFTIKVSKIKYNGEFTHWEADLSFSKDNKYCGVTAPTMAGAIGEVINYVYDSVYEWTKDDANDT